VYIRLTITQPHPDSLQPQGVFAATGALLWGEEEEELPEDERDRVIAILEWFREYLPIPRSEAITEEAVFWFKPDDRARACTCRIWELAYVLRSHGRLVQLHKTHHPGRIVFEDAYQVAAIPVRRPRSRLRADQRLDSARAWRRFIRRSKAAHRSAVAWRRT
jgi:hypothetical protein